MEKIALSIVLVQRILSATVKVVIVHADLVLQVKHAPKVSTCITFSPRMVD